MISKSTLIGWLEDYQILTGEPFNAEAVAHYAVHRAMEECKDAPTPIRLLAAMDLIDTKITNEYLYGDRGEFWRVQLERDDGEVVRSGTAPTSKPHPLAAAMIDMAERLLRA